MAFTQVQYAFLQQADLGMPSPKTNALVLETGCFQLLRYLSLLGGEDYRIIVDRRIALGDWPNSRRNAREK